MTVQTVIENLQWPLIGTGLALLLWQLVTGALRERSLAQCPARDLGLDRSLYLAAAISVACFVLLKLVIGENAPAPVILARDMIPFALIGLLIGRSMQAPGGFATIGLRPTQPLRDLAWGGIGTLAAIGLAVVVGVLIDQISTLMGRPLDDVAHKTLIELRENQSTAFLINVIIGAVILAPLMEEIIFRGILQTSLMYLLREKRWPAMLISAALFSITHWWAVPWQALIPLFVLGLVFGYIYERTGSLLAPVLTHAGFNAFNIAIALAMPIEAAG